MSRKLPIDVMISSTSKDLPLHRERAIRVVQLRGFFPQIMENLTASDRDAITDSLRLVDEAEIYVGIFGKRYGYVPDDPRNPDKISITEMEYRRALERGIPVLCFVMHEDHPAPANLKTSAEFFEINVENRQKHAALRNEIMNERIVKEFKSHDELGTHLLAALYDGETVEKAIFHLPAILRNAVEKMRNDPQPKRPVTSKRDVIPPLGEFYTRPAYVGGMSFVGRADELKSLDEWAENEAKPIMVVEAIGGQGKSALTWNWTNQNLDKFDGVVWWSFYTQGTTMTDFLRHTLAYISGRPLDSITRYDHEARTELLALLRRGKYLMVLDGLERVLTAYHRLDAAAVRDDQVNNNRDARATTNPKDRETLVQLLTCRSSKVLASTRLLPSAWDITFERLHVKVSRIKLDGLSPVDTLMLAEQAQIHIEDKARVTDFLGRYGYHPLVVGAILGLIGSPRNRRYRHSFDMWLDEHEADFSLLDLDLRQRQTHIVGHVIQGLTNDARELLARVALFHDAIPYDAISGLGITDETQYLDELILEIEASGLLMYDMATDKHDLHPVVRGYSQDLLKGEERKNAYLNVYDYFAAQPKEIYYEITSVEELKRSTEVMRSLQGAGQFEEALKMYSDGLSDHLLYNLGAYDLIQSLLVPFFPDGKLSKSPSFADAGDHAWIVNEMALALQYSGKPNKAIPLFITTLASDISTNDLRGLLVSLFNMADVLREASHLAAAKRFFDYALRLAVVTNSGLSEARFNAMVGAVSRGDWVEASDQYENNMEVQRQRPDNADLWCRCQMATALDELGTINYLERALRMNKDNIRYLTEIHYTWAIYALEKKQIETAQSHAEAAVNFARKTNDRIQGAALSTLAYAYVSAGRIKAAHDLIGQAARASCSPRFLPDREIGRAWVYYHLGNRDKAVSLAKKAYKLAWADGESSNPNHQPGYTWWLPLQRAKKLLKTLEVALPGLPEFDTLNITKLPVEDRIDHFITNLEPQDKSWWMP